MFILIALTHASHLQSEIPYRLPGVVAPDDNIGDIAVGNTQTVGNLQKWFVISFKLWY